MRKKIETTIQGCPMEFVCQKTWEDLKPTDDQRKRYCRECKENVHFCITQEELDQAVDQTHCVAYFIDEKRTEAESGMILGRPWPVLKRGESPKPDLD